jgi:CBS domain-containing protein
MNEIPEIERFLSELPEFASLTEAEQHFAARAVKVAYFKRDSDILTIGKPNRELHIIRSGAAELRNADGDLVTRLAEGDCFGFPSLMNDSPTRSHSRAIEDTLVYHLDGDAFATLRRDNPGFDTFFIRALSDRLLTQPQVKPLRGATQSTVGDLLHREPVCIDVSASIRDTAVRMVDERVSAMLVTRNNEVAGIVTDRDIRSRVVAAGLDATEAVDTIMTCAPIKLDADAHAYEAALVMMQNNIHHLPVTRDGDLVGMVSRSDFMRLETEHPLYLVSDLLRQSSAEGLASVCSRLPGLIAGQIEADVSSEQLGKFITTVTDAVTRQLIRIAEAELGPAPCDFAWIALGSQGRQEQSAKSDQDNGIVLKDGASDADRNYFLELATRVNAGLDACGYVYCNGDVMAKNPKWCQPLATWQNYFHRWITVPEQKALMHANIFFDLRAIYGNAAFVESLKDSIADSARDNTIFLALMAKNAMNFQPPLGFFRQFVLERSGEHKNTLDLKLHGIMPIVEIARIRSLAAGQVRVGTRNRLRAAAEAGEISKADAANLVDALDFIENVRLEHQSRQLKAGDEPDNHLPPADLSPLVRQNLKAAFSQVRISQAALLNRFHVA